MPSQPSRFSVVPATARDAVAMLGAGWGLVLFAALGFMALAASPLGGWPAGLTRAAIAVLLAGGLLSQRFSGGWPRPADMASVGLATALAGLVAAFLLLLAVLAGALVAFVVMAGSGFDFAAAGDAPGGFDAAFSAFLDTPGGTIAQAVFLLALAIWAIGLGRILPYAAASIGTSRPVVLGAFNLSRGRGIPFTLALMLALVPGIGCLVGAGRLAATIPQLAAIMSGAGTALLVLGAAAASYSTYKAATCGHSQHESS